MIVWKILSSILVFEGYLVDCSSLLKKVWFVRALAVFSKGRVENRTNNASKSMLLKALSC